MSADPQILLDTWYDGCIEERGWVEATVSPERACELLRPFVEDFPEPWVLAPAEGTEWHRPTSDDPNEEAPWEKCAPTDDGAVEFIRVEVEIREPQPGPAKEDH